MRRGLVAIVVVALAFAGCERTVSKSEVMGTWKMTDDSRKRIGPGAAGMAGTISLDPDGTFAAQEMPATLLGEGGAAPTRPVSGKGTWKLAVREGSQNVELVFDAIGSPPGTPVPYGAQLDVWAGRSTVLLFYFKGDPDSGIRIEFEKAGAEAGGRP
jgi:hypothetical protein